MIRSLGLSFMLIAVLLLLLSMVDDRVLSSGENVWMKPLRFALAFSIHAFTLWWIASFTERQAKKDAFFSWSVRLTAAVMILELILIGIQGARSVPSHFNYATAFDRQVFAWMGIGTIGLFAGFVGVFIGQVVRPFSPIATVSVGAGLVMATLGGLIGVWMVMPTESQRMLLEQGETLNWIGSHAVGVQSGEQIPLFSWDRAGGDWRVPHFIGIHGLQVLPLIGFLSLRFGIPVQRSWWAIALSVTGFAVLFLWASYRTYSGYSLFIPERENAVVLGLSVAMLVSAYALLIPTKFNRHLTP